MSLASFTPNISIFGNAGKKFVSYYRVCKFPIKFLDFLKMKT
jgi:hypothetical protein